MSSLHLEDEAKASTTKSKTTSRHGGTTSTAQKFSKQGLQPPSSTITRLPVKPKAREPGYLQNRSLPKTAPDGHGRDHKSSVSTIAKHGRKPSTSSTAGSSSQDGSSAIEESKNRKTPTPSLSGVLRPPSQSTILRPTAPTGKRPSQSTAAARPAFSTLQQHFSPAKSLGRKPATATFLAPPSPSKLPLNIAIDTDTTKLQTELLQLHLLHSSATSTQQLWKGSARAKFEQRWQKVRSIERALADGEKASIEQINATALHDWNSGSRGIPGLGLGERIPVLESLITGIWALSEPGGKYTRCVGIFEEWLVGAQQLLERRASDTAALDEFFTDIDSSWKDDCAALTRRLLGHRSQLNELGLVEGRSSLAVILQGCKSLTDDMMAELEAMQNIQASLADEERAWISAMCDALPDDDEDDLLSSEPIWARF